LPGGGLMCIEGIDAASPQSVGELRMKVIWQGDEPGGMRWGGMPDLYVACDGRLAAPRAEKSA
jgi:hypothetical protein